MRVVGVAVIDAEDEQAGVVAFRLRGLEPAVQGGAVRRQAAAHLFHKEACARPRRGVSGAHGGP